MSGARRLRVAVADDEPDMREYLGRILPLLGHEVVGIASTGAGLVDLCRRVSPDAIITDIKMPDMDGLDAVRAILTECPAAVIVVTGYQDRAHRMRAHELQVSAYLLKPVKRSDLEQALARVAGAR
ncbi:MAG: response regulator [Planctomycetes bacterium]|nr:response regulator [Planctomycetota bacterium]